MDDDLIARAAAGDRKAFGELYARYGRAVRDLCRRLVNDPARVEDLAQETFARALTHIERFRAGDRLWPWLSTIARNVCIDELRLRSGHKVTSLDEEFQDDARAPLDLETPADLVVRREDRARMRRELSNAFAHLAPHDRRILWLHSVEEWEYQDIARMDGSTVHTVRNIAFRARKRIRLVLEQTGGVPVVAPAWVLALRRWLQSARMRATNTAARMSAVSGELLLERAVILVASVTIALGATAGLSQAPSGGRSIAYVASGPGGPPVTLSASADDDRKVLSNSSAVPPQDPPVRWTIEPKEREGSLLGEGVNTEAEVDTPTGKAKADGPDSSCGERKPSIIPIEGFPRLLC